VADLISAIASLLWPLLVIVVLLVFGRQLLSKLRSSDDVTLEIGGQRLNFKQATDQQSDMITDLQREVASLKARLVNVELAGGVSHRERPAEVPPYKYPDGGVDNGWTGPLATPDDADLESEPAPESVPWGGAGTGGAAPGGVGAGAAARPGLPTTHSILWVDDHPENNAMLAESWRREGVHVEIARSTSEALHLLQGGAYGLIISDMGRRESGVDVPDAGLRLLAKVRASNPATPFVLYGNVGPFGEDARAAGATQLTDSTFELVEFATSLGLLDGA
jgi:CheY-like chemotaxis protein